MGKVQRITDFGAFIEIMPGLDGLLHVSEIATTGQGRPRRAEGRGLGDGQGDQHRPVPARFASAVRP
jgi:polyribonucleotide nucleotidyltransferase